MLDKENNFKIMVTIDSNLFEKPLQLLADTGSDLNVIISNALKNTFIENLAYALN